MIDSTTLGVLAFAASTGVATFFAPCAFPLLPGYVGYYLEQSERETPVLPAAGAAAVGALAALAVVAVLVLALGGPIRTALPLLEPVVGVGLIAFGVVTLLDRAPELRVPLPERPRSVVGFGVFGAVYAVAAAGCVVPLFVGVVTQALALPTASAAAVLAMYALGVTLPLVGVTLLSGAGVDAWRSAGRYTATVQRVAAVVMILAGLGQIYLSVFELDVLELGLV
jgi:cytochrome c-type biogenesis protein